MRGLIYLGAKNWTGNIAGRLPPGELSVVEPFCGGLNLLVQYWRPDLKIKCGDTKQHLIAMYNEMLSGWSRPEPGTRDEFENAREMVRLGIRSYIGLTLADAGWLAYECGMYGRGFEGGYNNKKEKQRQCAVWLKALGNWLSSKNNIMFRCQGYHHCSGGDIFILDPPYAGTKGYGSAFDYEGFIAWSRTLKCDKVYLYGFDEPPSGYEIIDFTIRTGGSMTTSMMRREWLAVRKK